MTTTTVAAASLTSITADTGASSTDFITSDNGVLGGTLRFTVTLQMNSGTGSTRLSIYLRPAGATDASHDILVGATNVNALSSTTNFNYSSAIADGTYQVIILNGVLPVNPIVGSPNPSVTIDTTAPLAPTVTYTDTSNPNIVGSAGDHRTSDATLSGAPGTTEAGDTVTIKEGGVVVATATST